MLITSEIIQKYQRINLSTQIQKFKINWRIEKSNDEIKINLTVISDKKIQSNNCKFKPKNKLNTKSAWIRTKIIERSNWKR